MPPTRTPGCFAPRSDVLSVISFRLHTQHPTWTIARVYLRAMIEAQKGTTQ